MYPNLLNVIIFIILLYRIAFAEKAPTKMEWVFIYIALAKITAYSLVFGLLCFILVCLSKDRNDGLFHKLFQKMTDLNESFQNESAGGILDLRGDAGKKNQTSSSSSKKEKIVFLEKNPEKELFEPSLKLNSVEKFFDLSESQRKFDENVSLLSKSIDNLKEYYANMSEKSSIAFDFDLLKTEK